MVEITAVEDEDKLRAELGALEVAVESLDAAVHAEAIAELSSEMARIQKLLSPAPPEKIICPTCSLHIPPVAQLGKHYGTCNTCGGPHDDRGITTLEKGSFVDREKYLKEVRE